jgi:hypothetical protein
MNLSKTLVLFFLFAGAVAARAQFGVYGTYSADRLSGIQCLAPASTNASTACSNDKLGPGPIVTGTSPSAGQSGAVNPSGFWGGAYYDFKDVGPVRLGIDFRGGEGHSNKSASSSAGGKDSTESYSALGGVRGSFRSPYPWLKPYAQMSVGWTRSDATELQHTFDNFIRYEGFAGIDIHLASLLDLRPVEVGIGDMQRIGTGTGSSSVFIRSIGAGIVLHLPSFQ